MIAIHLVYQCQSPLTKNKEKNGDKAEAEELWGNDRQISVTEIASGSEDGSQEDPGSTEH